jgi:hypothetical protein
MRSPSARPAWTGRPVLVALAVFALGGCSSSGAASNPAVASPTASALPTPGQTIQQLVAAVTAAGIDCSDGHHTGNDPGAVDQMTCGGLSHVIEIETFASASDVSSQFVPYLKDFFCSASPDTVYLDGGTWAIYATNNADIQKIAASMNLQPTKLC